MKKLFYELKWYNFLCFRLNIFSRTIHKLTEDWKPSLLMDQEIAGQIINSFKVKVYVLLNALLKVQIIITVFTKK